MSELNELNSMAKRKREIDELRLDELQAKMKSLDERIAKARKEDNEAFAKHQSIWEPLRGILTQTSTQSTEQKLALDRINECNAKMKECGQIIKQAEEEQYEAWTEYEDLLNAELAAKQGKRQRTT